MKETGSWRSCGSVWRIFLPNRSCYFLPLAGDNFRVKLALESSSCGIHLWGYSIRKARSITQPWSLAHCVDDNCDVNGNSWSRAGHVHQESPAAGLLNGGDTVSA